MLDALLTLIAPHHCTGCGKIGGLLCDNCKYDIISESYDRCLVCQRPSTKGICLDHRTPYERAWCVGERKDTLQRLIGTYKFQNAQAGYKPLTDLLDLTLPILPDNTVIVPIPTISSHIRERGYDHMRLVTRELAARRTLPVQRLLGRTSSTMQRHADRAQRQAQAAATFTITGSVDPESTYLLVDDVVTTGATIKYASRALKQAGATNIWIAALARQPLD